MFNLRQKLFTPLLEFYDLETLLTLKLYIIYVVQFAKKLKVNKSQFSYDKIGQWQKEY